MFSFLKSTNKKQVLLLVYGAGGHCSEMNQLLKCLTAVNSELALVSLGPVTIDQRVQAHYICDDIRSKHSRVKTLLLILPTLVKLLVMTIFIRYRFDVTGVISTGPGLSILPMLIMRLFGIKTVFVETSCRFNSRSMTGRVMSKIAHRFLVQNKQQLSLYPNAQYCGRL